MTVSVKNEIFRMAMQMVKERQDITGLNCIKGVSGKVIVDDTAIKDSWKEYMEKLMNEENEWDHKISAEVKEGLTDCIRMAEVRAVLTTTIYRLFSRTIWVSRYQKGKTNLDFTGARDSEWQWHQLGHMQVCTLLQTNNIPAPHHSVFTGRMPFLPPNQQRQSTEGTL